MALFHYLHFAFRISCVFAMFSDLNEILQFDVNNLPKRDVITIADSNMDANFLIHHFISLFIKGKSKICLLCLAQTFSHYSSVAHKLGINLIKACDDGQLTVIDGLQLSQEATTPITQTSDIRVTPLACIRNCTLDLKSLLVHITKRLLESGCGDNPVTLIIDDVSILISLGLSVTMVTDFIHHCQVWFCGRNGCVVLLLHDDKDVEDENNQQLHTLMIHKSSCSLQCQPLPSGYSRDVHGQINIMKREGKDGKPNRTISRQYHYKVSDKTMNLFAVGTSTAVL